MNNEYFCAEKTALTITERGAVAIVCGDKPRKNDDGTTSHSMRFPCLLVPEMVEDADGFAKKVAAVLNENADRFFSSAAKASAAAALALAMFSAPADAVTVVPPGPANGIRFTGDQPKWHGNSQPTHWNNSVAVGGFPIWASQHPDGPGVRGLPPQLGTRYICAVGVGGVSLYPSCGKKPLVPTEPPPCVVDCGPPPVSQIPLPASLPLFLAALAGFGLVRRMRR